MFARDLRNFKGTFAVLACIAMSASSLANAQSSTNTVTTTAPAPQEAQSKASVKAEAPKKEGEADVDEVITNRKLRAETGAKKKFSFSTSLGYSGGSVKYPGADVRPNITASLGTPLDPKLTGSVSMKVKLTPLQSLSANIGVGIDKPFHSDAKKTFGERSYANNPGMSYQTVYKTGGIQNVSTVSASAYTSNSLKELGMWGGIGLSQTLAYDFGGSKFSMGTSVQASTSFYEKDDRRLLRSQGDFAAGVFPFIEYVISDKLNLRTLVGFMTDHSRATPDFWTWKPNTVYQSIGVGITVTRDIYLYPNIQLIPEDIRDDRTNVAMTATINL